MFYQSIQNLTPCQLYISEEKLRNVYKWFDGDISKMQPVSIRPFAGRLIVVDGHTRLAAAWLSGAREVPCKWETDVLNWTAYASDITVCSEEGVISIEELSKRIVSVSDYEKLWRSRCDAMENEWHYKVLMQNDEIIFFTRNAPNISVCDVRKIDAAEDIQYYGLFYNDNQVARGCIEKYSYEFWEAADIRTIPECRNKGFGYQITAFLTKMIVENGKTATCRTLPNNIGMNRVIEKCGYGRLYV